MPRSRTITGTHSFEIEIALTGTYQPGYPGHGPTYASGGEPPEPPMVEDMDVIDIGILVRNPDGNLADRNYWLTKSILAGVDRQSEAFRQIAENILKIEWEGAEANLLGEAE